MGEHNVSERGRLGLSDNIYVNHNYTPNDPDKNDERFSTALFGYSKEEVEKYINNVEQQSAGDKFFNEDLVELQKANRALVHKLSELERNLNEANYQIEATANRTNVFSKNEDELKGRIESLQSKITLLQDALIRETDEKKQSYVKLSDAFEQIEKLKSTNSSLNQRMAETHAEIERFSTELESARMEAARLRTEYSKNESVTEEINTKLSITKNTLVHTESLLDKTQIELAEEQAEHSMTKSELISAKTELANARVRLSDTTSQLTGLQGELNSTLSELSSEREKSSNAINELTTLKAQFAAGKSELSRLTNELNSTRDMLNSARAEIESIRAELDARNNEISELNNAAQDLKNMLSESDSTIDTMRVEINAKDEHIDMLLRQYDDMGYDIMRLNEEVQEKSEKLASTSEKLVEMEAKAEDRSTQLEDKKALLKQRDHEINDLQNRIQSLEQQIRNLDRRREIAEESMREAHQRVSMANRTLREYSAREVQAAANMANRTSYGMPRQYNQYYNTTQRQKPEITQRFDQRTAGRSGYQSMQIPLSQINAQLPETHTPNQGYKEHQFTQSPQYTPQYQRPQQTSYTSKYETRRADNPTEQYISSSSVRENTDNAYRQYQQPQTQFIQPYVPLYQRPQAQPESPQPQLQSRPQQQQPPQYQQQVNTVTDYPTLNNGQNIGGTSELDFDFLKQNTFMSQYDAAENISVSEKEADNGSQTPFFDPDFSF